MIRIAVITISDKGSQGLREDKSGPSIKEFLQDIGETVFMKIIPDEREQISQLLIKLCDEAVADLIFTTGGTGLSPRDVTPEATKAILDKEVPGLSEAIRAASLQYTSRAMLSRAVSGIRRSSLIVNLPGSPKGAVESLGVIKPVLKHAVETLKGEAYECARKE